MNESAMQKKFMERAIELSRRNIDTKDGGPFGAVIVRDGKIVGEGWNQVDLTTDPTAHAEVVAIRNACAQLQNVDLTGCEVYTSCEPCPMCLAALYWSRVSKVYYGNSKEDATEIQFDDQFIYEEIAKPHSKRVIPLVQMMRDEAWQVFKFWEQKML